jgi:hypothetical protein
MKVRSALPDGCAHRRSVLGRALVGVPLALLLVVLAACSSSKSNGESVPSTVGPQSTIPESNGFTCHDPVGDISKTVNPSVAGTLTEPAGIDLVLAEAHVDGQELAVSYTTNGPISMVPDPFFTMIQGDMGAPQYTFELRTELASDGWHVTLITFPAGSQEQHTPLSVPVTATGNTLTYRVPLTDIPRIATLQWNFGATSTAQDQSVVFDDCQSVTAPPEDGSTATTGGG